jgi:hypothetical protein
MSSLTQRYISAAVTGVPEPARDDVAEELRASVADAVEAHVAAGMAPAEAEVRALSDLGDPAVLAERFGGRPRHLIGPAYFGHYQQLLKTLLAVVLPIVTIAVLIAEALAGAAPLDVLVSALGTVFQVGVQIAFWVTVVFAVLERTHTPMPTAAWTPDALPEVPDRRVGLGETVAGVAGLVLLMWAMIWQRDHWLVTVGGAEVPVLNEDVWIPWVVTLLVIVLASIVLAIVVYRSGHWTVPLAIVNTVLNVAFAGLVVWLWSAGTLLTPGVADLVPDGLLAPVPWIVVGIAVFDTLGTWWDVLRDGRE